MARSQITVVTELDRWLEYGDGVAEKVRAVVNATALAVEGDAKVSMTGPKHGEVYGKTAHQASAPGEAPAIDTGLLAASINTETAARGDTPTAYVNVASDHALPLEFGTIHMAARPFLGPAVEGRSARFDDELQRALS